MDDLLNTGGDEQEKTKLAQALGDKYELEDRGEPDMVVGIEVRRHKNGYHLSQSHYVEMKLEEFKIPTITGKRTVPHSSGVAGKRQPDEEKGDQPLFRRLLGALHWIAANTRPDLSWTVNTLSRYQQDPASRHVQAAIRVFQYLRDTKTYGLLYTNKKPQLEVYVDSDHGGDPDTRRSTTGSVASIAAAPVEWTCSRQSITAISSTEAEYVAMSTGIQQAMHLRMKLDEIGHKQDEPTSIWCDNQSAIFSAKNQDTTGKLKHVDIRLHFVRDYVQSGEVIVIHLSTKDQIADILTKAVGRERFSVLRDRMGVKPPPKE